MTSDHKPAFDFHHTPPRDLIVKSTIVYTLMIVIGILAMAYGHESLGRALAIDLSAPENLRLLVIGLIGAGLLQILSFFFEDWFPSFRDLKAIVMRILGPLNPLMAVYMAMITSLGEEMVFRGAIQPVAGLWVASFLFGLMHVGPGGILSAWSLWAMLAGALLGWIFQETSSLWPCILAHFLVNFISIMGLRRHYKKWLEATTEATRSTRDHVSAVENESDSRV